MLVDGFVFEEERGVEGDCARIRRAAVGRPVGRRGSDGVEAFGLDAGNRFLYPPVRGLVAHVSAVSGFARPV